MNLGPLAKGRHGVKRRSPQAVGRSQKEDVSSSLDTVSDAHNQGSQETLPTGHEAHSQQSAV